MFLKKKHNKTILRLFAGSTRLSRHKCIFYKYNNIYVGIHAARTTLFNVHITLLHNIFACAYTVASKTFINYFGCSVISAFYLPAPIKSIDLNNMFFNQQSQLKIIIIMQPIIHRWCYFYIFSPLFQRCVYRGHLVIYIWSGATLT